MMAELHRLRTLGTKLGTERPQLTKRNYYRCLSGYLAEGRALETNLLHFRQFPNRRESRDRAASSSHS